MRRTKRIAALSCVLLLALGACSGHHGSGKKKSKPVYNFSLVELEPNNSVFSANVAGALLVGDRYTIYGSITDSGADPFDGFAFFPQEDLDLEFTLYTSNPNAVLELCQVDPYATVVPICWNNSVYEIQGVIAAYAGEELHLVISSLWSASNYELYVDAYPPVYLDGGRPAASPAESPAPAAEHLAGYFAGSVASAPQAEAAPRLRGVVYAVDGAGEVHRFEVHRDATGPVLTPARESRPSARTAGRTTDLGSERAF